MADTRSRNEPPSTTSPRSVAFATRSNILGVEDGIFTPTIKPVGGGLGTIDEDLPSIMCAPADYRSHRRAASCSAVLVSTTSIKGHHRHHHSAVWSKSTATSSSPVTNPRLVELARRLRRIKRRLLLQHVNLEEQQYLQQSLAARLYLAQSCHSFDTVASADDDDDDDSESEL